MFLNRKKSNRKNDGEAKKLSSLFNFFLGFVVFILVMTVFGVIGFYAFTMDLPGIDALKDYRPSISSRVYDDKNELIDEFFLEDRKLIKIKEVPRVVVQAFVAAEDSRFFARERQRFAAYGSDARLGVKAELSAG